MEPTISVRVDDPCGEPVYCAMDIPVDMLRAFRPIVTYDDPMIAMLAGGNRSTDKEIYKTLKIREDAAERLSKTIAEHLVRAMSKNDTHNDEPRLPESQKGE